MGVRSGPDELLHSLAELRPSEAKRQFRKSILEDYPLRGPFGHCACAYCGKWGEKLTLDHVVPKSKGGPHFAKFNLVPACLACNAKKSNFALINWWRQQEFWTKNKEATLLSWVYANSLANAHVNLHEYELWMEKIGYVAVMSDLKSVSWQDATSLHLFSAQAC
jgi:hypothetical protein